MTPVAADDDLCSLGKSQVGEGNENENENGVKMKERGVNEGKGKNKGEGRLVPLKTTLEIRGRERMVDVWVGVVDVRMASGSLSIIRKLVPNDGGLDIQHLRRFAKLTEVPSHVKNSFTLSLKDPIQETEGTKLFLIIGLVSAVSLEDLISVFPSEPIIFSTKVPLLAPTSQQQAKAWTARYWPTVYKKSNPFGPHPSIISRSEDEIRDEVQLWMDLAHDVAREAKDSGIGENIGVVIVERKAGIGKVVAVAGDARWSGCKLGKRGIGGGGNVTAHAAMRVIGMVANALRMRDEQSRNASATGLGDEEAFEVSRDSISASIISPHPPEQSRYTIEAKAQNGREDLISISRSKLVHTPETNSTTLNSRGEHGVDSPAFVAAETSPPSSSQHQSADNEVHGASTASCQANIDIFQDHPILPLEKEYFDQDGNKNGYLCHDLEIYCTHEPCVMCSMAMVHSRFGRVVFEKRMRRTGAMCADGDLGHGLAWRKELNWTLLAWHWKVDGQEEEEDSCGELHA